MNTKPIADATNPLLRQSYAALQQAAQLAREEAIKTNTGIVVSRNGKVVTISAAELKAEQADTCD